MTILVLIIITLYVVIMIYKNKGIPNSISATYYILQHKYWFCFTMISVGIILLIALLDTVSSNIQFLVFLACSGIIFVGAAPNFKEQLEKKVHEIGAIICISGSQILIILTQPIILLLWVPWIIYILLKLKINNLRDSFLETKPLFWIEIISFTTIFLLLL